MIAAVIVIPIMVAGLLAVFGLLAMTFNAILRHEHSRYRQQWEADGRPHGFLCFPEGSHGFGSWLAFQRCAFTWTFSTPGWARSDEEVLGRLRSLRWLVGVWNVGCVVLFVTMFLVLRPVA